MHGDRDSEMTECADKERGCSGFTIWSCDASETADLPKCYVPRECGNCGNTRITKDGTLKCKIVRFCNKAVGVHEPACKNHVVKEEEEE
jgi:hypothetical protein